MGKQSGRHARLLQIVKAQGMLPARTLADILQVSEMTIRRDIKKLSFAQGVEQVAKQDKTSDENGEYNLFLELEKHNKQKKHIGKFAASLVKPNDVIAIDTGSTTAKMLAHIPSNMNLTVLCYNANVLAELRYRAGIQILFGGGVFHRNTEMCESEESISFIRRVRLNKVFLSAAGVHKDLGVTCAHSYEVPSKKAVIESSAERILVVDSGKFDILKQAHFCELADINTIVSDKNLSQEWCELIKEKGIKLHLA